MTTNRDRLEYVRANFPGWFIWYVPGLGAVSWHARRLPLLQAPSAGELAAAIAAAEGTDVLLADSLSEAVPLTGRERFDVLDRLRAELRATFPNWHTVYSPNRDGSVEWETYALPLLHADRAEDLATDMRAVESPRAAGSDRPVGVTFIRPQVE
jgi:hypothetical protein